ncbi:uncharacterized protein LOC143286127 [Babylonia areolata]|uniref:uncharacterized protein LOC143286127 n=1 Tax=Babylonia areolata TaxID=304850 RepID=UPI003FD10AE4
MYFCPCSCSKTDCENEEDVLIYLPRNLSYAGESYLDRYSVSSAFVHNAKLEKQLLQADVQEQYLKAGAAACAEAERGGFTEEETGAEGGAEGGVVERPREEEKEEKERAREKEEEDEDDVEGSDSEHLLGARAMARPVTCSEDPAVFRGGPDSYDVSGDTALALPSPTPVSASSPLLPHLTVTIERDKNPERQSGFERYVGQTAESPDSDLVSEEGIFVNMMDDLDGLGAGPGGKCTLSEASDDTYVSGDSMYYSPVEVDDMEDEHVLKVSLEEAVLQAAIDFQAPSSSSSPQDHHSSSRPAEHGEEENGVTLPLPHANDGESGDGDCAATHAESGEGGGQAGDCAAAGPESGAGSAEDAVVTLSGEDDQSRASPEAVLRNTVTPLEIQLNDMALSQQADGGGERPALTSSYRDLLSPDSPLYEDREFNFTRTELRKSTSLKSTKTPPGTPRRKKVVRFADAMGLDLESVRHVLNLESPPKIPPSAMKDLQAGLSEDRKNMGSRYISETFTQPGADPRFRERVLADKVVLENALIVTGAITGVVRVANLSFHKAVRVRFTTNGWASFHDIAASYMVNSNDGPTDRFSFTLVPPPDFVPGSRLECAISYSSNGAEYWDNNYGMNYVFECYAKTVPTEAENAWMHFL